jgi:1-acyl-sn-glycerol-3-phosphate acyltransferase
MLAHLRALDPPQPLRQVLFYRLCYWVVLSAFVLVYRARFWGVERVPRAGGVLVIANHQSHLDPPLLGVALRHRNMAAIARVGLFRNPLMGALLRGLGCIAIREDEGDAGALRTAIEQLKRGRVVVIFPEGSRSPDGALKDFKRGTWLLLARSGAPVVPAAVEGCFDAWPRQRRLPLLLGQRVAVAFGEPVPFETLKAMGGDAGLAHLAAQVEALRLDLRDKLRRATHGRLPAPGPGDTPWSPRPEPARGRSPKNAPASA